MSGKKEEEIKSEGAQAEAQHMAGESVSTEGGGYRAVRIRRFRGRRRYIDDDGMERTVFYR